jgi:hypothetical protein
MCHMSITPSITVTIGRHTRLLQVYAEYEDETASEAAS